LDVPTFLNEMRNRQIAWMSPTTVAGIPAVRACVTSFKTTSEDIHWVVDEINKIAIHGAAEQMAHA
jgi:hypothetical protein